MLKLTQVKIQESPELRGVNQDKGITSDDLTCDRVLLSDPVHAAIHGKMTEALEGYMDQIALFAEENGKDGEKVRTSMEASILKFKLDAGGGYTDTHKADLIENGTASGVEVEAIDFVAPKNRGGATPSASSSEVTGEMEL